MAGNAESCLVGVDLSASRIRAVAGTAEAVQLLPLDGKRPDLPLALSLEGGFPEVGRAGLQLFRRLPHFACVDFLPHLNGSRRWTCGRQALDANDALAVVLAYLQPCWRASRTTALALALPTYLDEGQIRSLFSLATHASWPVAGAVPAPLAAALTAHAAQPWSGLALVVDVDDHALTWAAVAIEEGWARLTAVQSLPHLGARGWKQRLLNAVADRCVRRSRRDPRDSAQAEQSLYEQLENALDTRQPGRGVELAIVTPQWYQNLILRREELAGLCAPLVHQVLGARAAVEEACGSPAIGAVLVTAAAARLPGLVAALEERDGEVPADDLIPLRPKVQVLTADDAALAAHAVALHVCSGTLPAGYLDSAPLPPPQPVDAGPARLHFHGQEYPLPGRAFVLGCHSSCDLVFDAEQYPALCPRHCEIVTLGRAFVLRDRSNQGTMLNGRPVVQELPLRPGDWIRLGADGPRLRFLGQLVLQAGSAHTAIGG